MGLVIRKKAKPEVEARPVSAFTSGSLFERRQFAILFLWEGYALTDNECARAFVLSAITHLSEMEA